jgi:hypothetical protein
MLYSLVFSLEAVNGTPAQWNFRLCDMREDCAFRELQDR